MQVVSPGFRHHVHHAARFRARLGRKRIGFHAEFRQRVRERKWQVHERVRVVVHAAVKKVVHAVILRTGDGNRE